MLSLSILAGIVPTTHDWSWDNDLVNQRPSVTYNKHAGGFWESCNLIAHLTMTVAFYTCSLSIFYLEYVPTTHDWSWENDLVNQRPSVTYNKHAAGFRESCNLIAHLRMTVAFYTCSLSIIYLEYVPTTQLIFRKWFVKLKIISYIKKKTCRGCLGSHVTWLHT
jgi:hypothetical protein